MQNVLIIAPPAAEQPVATVREALHCVGYRVARTAPDAGEAMYHAFSGVPPEILIADLSRAADMLPLRHTLRVLRQIWGDEMPTPISLVLLTAAHLSRREWLTITDDFVLPPYAPAEVLSRLELLLFRRRQLTDPSEIVFADLRLDIAVGLALTADGQLLPLTPREYQLLRFLLVQRGKLFSRSRLIDFVWGLEFSGGERTVDIHIRRLRAKLPPQAAALLETRRGMGYGFLVRPPS
jgi:two-component system, OmpR family, alkaline phosphatase synthesis response regulator PhoP